MFGFFFQCLRHGWFSEKAPYEGGPNLPRCRQPKTTRPVTWRLGFLRIRVCLINLNETTSFTVSHHVICENNAQKLKSWCVQVKSQHRVDRVQALSASLVPREMAKSWFPKQLWLKTFVPSTERSIWSIPAMQSLKAIFALLVASLGAVALKSKAKDKFGFYFPVHSQIPSTLNVLKGVRKYYPNSPIYLLQDGGNVDFGKLCQVGLMMRPGFFGGCV